MNERRRLRRGRACRSAPDGPAVFYTDIFLLRLLVRATGWMRANCDARRDAQWGGSVQGFQGSRGSQGPQGLLACVGCRGLGIQEGIRRDQGLSWGPNLGLSPAADPRMTLPPHVQHAHHDGPRQGKKLFPRRVPEPTRQSQAGHSLRPRVCAQLGSRAEPRLGIHATLAPDSDAPFLGLGNHSSSFNISTLITKLLGRSALLRPPSVSLLFVILS